MPNIVVCYKWVIDEADVRVESGGSLNLERAARKISEYDRNAIEAAAQLHEQHGGDCVAVSLGGPEVQNSAREALARGPERAVLAVDPAFENADARITAHGLAAAIRQAGPFDLILCGEGSGDQYNQQVGPRIAALLDIPCITFVSKLELTEGGVRRAVAAGARPQPPAGEGGQRGRAGGRHRRRGAVATTLGKEVPSMGGIWVISEQPALLCELIGGGRDLTAAFGGTLTAVAVGDRTAADEAAACGADEVVFLEVPEGQPLESAAAPLADLLRAADPDVVLVGATLRGKDLAARLAARLDAPLASEAANIRVEGGDLLGDRRVDGGSGVATVALTARPRMATVPARVFRAPECAAGAAAGASAGGNAAGAAVVRTVAVPADSRVRIVERRPRQGGGADIAEADVVVAVGRGLPDRADLGPVEELAAVLGGAVGCTRPVAEDLGWLPEDRYIGISGRKVAPSVYIAVATSGQVQHIAGMRDSRLVVAINTDENAPIFREADYGLVADAREAVPALTAALRQRLG